MKILSVLLILISLVTQAGVRTVGNGGGYAEMKAVLINDQLPTFLEVCLNDLNSCGLSQAELIVVKSVLQIPMNLKFKETCTESPISILDDQKRIAIESCVLYHQGQSVAKDFSEIGVWVLTARLSATTHADFHSSQSIAEKVFRDYQETEQKIQVVITQSQTEAHFLSVKKLNQQFSIISLEGAKVSLDITAPAKKSLACDGTSVKDLVLSFTAAQEISPSKALVEADATWTCEGKLAKSFQGTLQIFYSVSQSEISPETVHVQLVGKQLN